MCHRSKRAGKSTLLNSVMGAVPIEMGEILFEGKPLAKRSHKVVASGISLVPEGENIGPLTVSENLMVGAFKKRQGASSGGFGMGLHSFPSP